MRKLLIMLLCIVTVSSLYNPAQSQTIYVPLNSDVYDFIDRLQTKRIIENVLTGSKPFTRLETAKILLEIYNNKSQLSKIDNDNLNYFLFELKEEIDKLDKKVVLSSVSYTGLEKKIKDRFPSYFYSNDRNMFSFKKQGLTLYGDYLFKRDFSNTDSSVTSIDNTLNRFTTGLKIWGTVGDNLGFYMHGIDTKEWGSREYPLGINVPVKYLGWATNFRTYQYHDETIAYLNINLGKYINLMVGKDLNKWGPGKRGNLLLNDKATSYDQIKLVSKVWKLKFTSVFGSLIQYPKIIETESDPENGIKEEYASKYLAAHRVEFELFNNIKIGLGETVVFGQRDIELAYLNPIMFYWSAEHYLGDQDNSLIGLDVEYHIKNGMKVFGELLLDDLKASELGTNWFGNKFGFNGGLFLTDPFGINNSNLRVEYTKLKPFLYTHKFLINTYQHFTTSLGNVLQPNSDELYIGFDYSFSRKFSLDSEFIKIRHGANPKDENIGGDIDVNHDTRARDYIGFLEGKVEHLKEYNINFKYELYRNLFLNASYSYLSGNDIYLRETDSSVDVTVKKYLLGIRLNY